MKKIKESLVSLTYTENPEKPMTQKRFIERIFTNERIRTEVKSAAITFIAVFLPTFALSVQGLQWESLELAGGSAALLTILRLAVKAMWEASVALIVYLSTKVNK